MVLFITELLNFIIFVINFRVYEFEDIQLNYPKKINVLISIS